MSYPMLRRCGAVVLLLAWGGVEPATASETAPPSSKAASSDAARFAEARQRFKKGVGLFREGDNRAALIEFKRAYKLAPNYRVLYNIGQISVLLHEYAKGLEAFRRYLKEGRDQVPAERKQAVNSEIARLEGLVARIKVTTDSPGAQILIDNIVVGTSPLEGPILTNAGRHKVSAEAEGMPAIVRHIDIAGGDEVSVHLVVPTRPSLPAKAPEVPAPDATELPSEDKLSQGRGKTLFWVSLGVSAALATAAAVTGGLAIKARSDYQDEVDTIPTTAATIDDAHGRVRTLAIATDILVAATAVGAGITLYLALRNRGEAPEKATASRLKLRAGLAAIALSGEF